ncbi:cytochrome P450 [Trametes punicea]|nr:cytochrome P450 [Trametes punicea]
MVTSLIQDAMQKKGEVSPEEAEILRDSAAVAYLAGADTTLYSTQALFLAIILYPEVQRKAQQELDAVVGPDRLPEFSDRDSLPHIAAVVEEVIRWHTVVPLGIFHRAMEEDEWNGYRIPAGSIIVPNQWAMSRDADVYPDPEKFIPERFLPGEKGNMAVRDPVRYQFGFGRRICPGRYFALDALFITVASLLHVFNIGAPLGGDGKPMRVNPNINLDNFLSYPEPFKCRIVPRSDKAGELVRDSCRMQAK